MSSTNLAKSVKSSDYFPKDAVFQHEFYAALSSILPPSYFICPELSHVFPEEQQIDNHENIAGKVDFYINGKVRWGIELLIQGDAISEHVNRFAAEGNYAPLCVSDYIIIDFRRTVSGNPSNVASFEKRLLVFFKRGSFSSCKCIFGLDSKIFEVQLRS
jgi:hypothetical protein